MKKIISVIFSLLLLGAITGCTTTKVAGSGIKGKLASVKTGKRIIVDYQGATFGKEIPEWVVLLSEGQYSQKVLASKMPDLDGKKVFVTTGRGDNLDFVQTWSDLVDIETEVAGTLERVAGKVVEAEMKGASSTAGKEVKSSEVNRYLDMYRASLVNVRISGLERVASYWVETQVIENKKVTDDYFEYYAVWAMDEKLFDKQLNEAMSKIDETSTEAKRLKGIVSSRLKDTIAISNNESVKNEADEYVIGQ